ncbi:hypothetical protein FH972_024689 [Carpinus fangiana]|uniref:Chitin-binding type-4 domain-containing protein n=1 Tax=Carpinus fangiana TaxID=176857 RepID=A0A5N6KZL9_9ROSI|nr:hypothetical protein FH972_024689 [Carpinus fangiana]
MCGSLVAAHMEMITPFAIKSQYDPEQVEADKEYSMTSPLLADGSNFPCKGFQNDASRHTTAGYTAGLNYQLALKGTATHEGGSCQISLSYDNGKTFRVIKSMIGGCPLVSEYDFTVPAYAPNGTALLAWTWENHTGNREFYMNCAQVDISSDIPLSSASAMTSSNERRSKARRQQGSFTQWSDLPYIWKANVPTVNDCVTEEGVNYIYPNPGPDVAYGGGESADSPVTPGNCDSPDPAGPTYQK